MAACVAITTVGCQNVRDVRTAKAYAMVDTIPGGSSKGYVEFTAHENEAVVPIYQTDGPGKPKVLGAVGLKDGDKYARVRYKTDVSTKLRVAVSPGMHNFTVEKDGQRFRVPVEEGKVTPVEIDYTLLEKGETLDIYHADIEVQPLFTPTDSAKSGGKK